MDDVGTTEIDLLYSVSNKLVQASTPQQQLEAVSDYARLRGATQGALFYVENPERDDASWVVTRAEWVLDERHRLGIGQRFETAQGSFAHGVFSRLNQPTLVQDVNVHPGIDEPLLKALMDHSVRGAAILPLSNNGRRIGTLWFVWNEPHTFNRQDEQIYITILQQIGPIIDSHRLLEQTHQRTTELEGAYYELDLLYRTGEAINRADTYQALVEAFAHFDETAEGVSLMLWENLDWETATYLDIVCVIDRTGNSLLKGGDRLRKEDFPVAQCMLGKLVWDFSDTQNDPRVDGVTKTSWKSLGVLSFFGTALYVGDRWLGGATFHSSQPRSFSERQRRLLAGIGNMVLGAVERIRLKDEKEAAMRTYAVLEERNRLARELHDSVSQALYGIVLSMKTAQVQQTKAPDQLHISLDYALLLSQAALSEMRALIFELRPETLEKEGLVEALTRQIDMIQIRYGVRVYCELPPEPLLSLHIKEHVYWIAREALHNVVKHARAAGVWVHLVCESATVFLEILDDGIGFDTTHDFAGHLGLKSMTERAARLNGTLEIKSSADTGTTITLRAPC